MPPHRVSSQFDTGFVPFPSRFRSRDSFESLRKMPAVKSTLTDILPVSTAHKSVAVEGSRFVSLDAKLAPALAL